MEKPGKLIKTPFDQLTYDIIGCVFESHKSLGAGYREDTYQRDLEARLAEKNIPFEAQRLYEVYGGQNRDVLIGYYIPDFVVDEKVVVEIKALPALSSDHTAQVIAYLAVTGCPLGLLINFGEAYITPHRILPPKDVQEHRANRRWLFVPDWLRESPTEG